MIAQSLQLKGSPLNPIYTTLNSNKELGTSRLIKNAILFLFCCIFFSLSSEGETHSEDARYKSPFQPVYLITFVKFKLSENLLLKNLITIQPCNKSEAAMFGRRTCLTRTIREFYFYQFPNFVAHRSDKIFKSPPRTPTETLSLEFVGTE